MLTARWRRPSPISALRCSGIVRGCVQLDAMWRTVHTPGHGTHCENRVGGEEVLLLSWVACGIDDKRVLNEVDVLASLGHVLLARRIDVQNPKDAWKSQCLRSPLEFFCLGAQKGRRDEAWLPERLAFREKTHVLIVKPTAAISRAARRERERCAATALEAHRVDATGEGGSRLRQWLEIIPAPIGNLETMHD